MDILKLFQYEENLKFTDIERALKVRSNKLAYHLKNLTKKGVLTREGSYYCLSETSEHIVPYLSEKKPIIPVIIIKIGDKKNCFMHIRKKRPFKDKLSLPGGRQLLSESINQTVERIMKEEFNTNAKLRQIHSVSMENLLKNKKIIQTDMVIYVSATTKDKIVLTEVEKNKKKIITSDYFLLKNDSNKKIDIQTINTKEN